MLYRHTETYMHASSHAEQVLRQSQSGATAVVMSASTSTYGGTLHHNQPTKVVGGLYSKNNTPPWHEARPLNWLRI